MKSVGNGEAKELTCLTHGHEIRVGFGGGMMVGEGYRVEGKKGKKK